MDYEKGKSTEEYGYGDANPPPYPGNHADPPTYQAPTFHDTTTPHSKGLVPATARFPPIFNCYYHWKWKQVYYLGPSSDERNFAISFGKKLFTKTESLFLHDGPDDKAPIMASASRNVMGWKDRATITVNEPYGSGTETTFVKPENVGWRKSEFRCFRYRTGKGHVEEFQWRSSHGNEIKELAGRSSGWKLVRMTGPESGGGRLKNPELGFSSDGQEVVAVLAHNTSWSMTKEFNFAFMGTGLTGTLGEEWEALAAISGFWLWYMQMTTNSTSSGTAAASSACVAAAAS